MLFLGRGGARLQNYATTVLSRCLRALRTVNCGAWRGARRVKDFKSAGLAACKDTSKNEKIDARVRGGLRPATTSRRAGTKHFAASWAKSSQSVLCLGLIYPDRHAHGDQRRRVTHARTICGAAQAARHALRATLIRTVQQQSEQSNTQSEQQSERHATAARCPSSASRRAARSRCPLC